MSRAYPCKAEIMAIKYQYKAKEYASRSKMYLEVITDLFIGNPNLTLEEVNNKLGITILTSDKEEATRRKLPPIPNSKAELYLRDAVNGQKYCAIFIEKLKENFGLEVKQIGEGEEEESEISDGSNLEPFDDHKSK